MEETIKEVLQACGIQKMWPEGKGKLPRKTRISGRRQGSCLKGTTPQEKETIRDGRQARGIVCQTSLDGLIDTAIHAQGRIQTEHIDISGY